MNYKIDWLSFSVYADETVGIDKNLIKKLGYDFAEFEKCKGRYFYNSGVTYFKYVYIYFNSPNLEEEEEEKTAVNRNSMTVVFTGQGCTELAEKWQNDWVAIFKLLEDYSASVTRLDIALDDFAGQVSFDKIEKKLDKGEYRSSARSYNVVKSKNAKGEILGRTIYIGKARADNGKDGNIYARFYDKRAQYIETNQILPDHAQACWQRYEISYSKLKARRIVQLFLNGFSVDRVFKESLRNLLEILVRNPRDENKARWKVAKWWNDFLQFDDKIKFENAERDARIGDLLKWLRVSVVPTLGLLEKIGEERGFDIYELLKQAKKPTELRKKQARLMNHVKTLDDETINKYLKEFLE